MDSEDHAEQLAHEVATFYNALVRDGVPVLLAEKLTSDYLTTRLFHAEAGQIDPAEES